MTLITVTCRYCSQSSGLRPRDVLLTTHTRHPELDHYQFKCQGCGHVSNKPAGPDVRKLLDGSGCRRHHIHIPEEADDPIRYGGCRDDLLDALTELQGDITCPTQ